ncbi:hypothetical protein [Gordonia shandongensis]|uniref:hypothetical protein n=1 Tax=Gordonia shandongensis TaxID=376351 RepID=UPI00042276FC|nr:hypothetical protein [Gordonia shandongensis]
MTTDDDLPRVDPDGTADHDRRPQWGRPARTAEEIVDAADCGRVWAMADRVFPLYADYRTRAAATGRTIPLVRIR